MRDIFKLSTKKVASRTVIGDYFWVEFWFDLK